MSTLGIYFHKIRTELDPDIPRSPKAEGFKPMKVYIAAAFGRREEMAEHADRMKAAGHTVTARWVYGGEDGLTREQIALLDLDDVDAADTVVSFTYPYRTPHTGGGRHVEFGYGLARGKRVVLIGDRENVFHHHPKVEVFNTLDGLLAAQLPVDA